MTHKTQSRKIIRRVLWNLYAVPITLLILPSDFIEIYTKGPAMFPFATLDFLISFPSLVAIQLHIWDKQLFVPALWKVYAFVFILWDFAFNIIIEPALTHETFDPSNLIFAGLCVPLYVAVFRYAFRKWQEIPPIIDSNWNSHGFSFIFHSCTALHALFVWQSETGKFDFLHPLQDNFVFLFVPAPCSIFSCRAIRFQIVNRKS